jgi:hypothetical protein
MTPDFLDFSARLRQFIHSSCKTDPHDDHGFTRLALDLFALQYHQNPAYRQLCDRRGVTPAHISHWTQIPAAPTSAFKQLEMTSLPPESRSITFLSSGTTADTRSRHHHSAESLSLYHSSLLPWFARHLLPGDAKEITILSLTPPATAAPSSSLVHMFETIRQHYGSNDALFGGVVSKEEAWTLNIPAITAHLSRAVTLARPVLLLGTAFNFVQLLDHCSAAGLRFDLPIGSRILETGGYKGRSRSMPRPELHCLLTETLGVPSSHIITEYGMSELSSQAYDGVVGQGRGERLLRFPPWARLQIVSPENGQPVTEAETGLIRVFDLANVWSVAALQTEDLGIQRPGGFELIGRIPEAEPRGCSLMAS